MPKTDWGSVASGAASGTATGFALGGPIGAGVGFLAGGGLGFLGGKKKKKKKKLSTLDKKQQQLNDQQHQAVMGEGPLADLYNYDPEKANEVFDQNIGRKTYRDLNEKGIPALTGQFRNQGLMNSSYAGDAIGNLIRNTQEDLSGKRANFLYNEQNNARSAKQNAVENLQNRQTFAYDNSAPKSGGFDISKVLSSISPEMISGLTKSFTGGA